MTQFFQTPPPLMRTSFLGGPCENLNLNKLSFFLIHNPHFNLLCLQLLLLNPHETLFFVNRHLTLENKILQLNFFRGFSTYAISS